MNQSNLLEGVTIVDLSTRLPGPLAAMFLAKLGARVIKIEEINFPDPFKESKDFKHWYKAINSCKEVHQIDYENTKDYQEFLRIVQGCDAIVMGLSPKAKTRLKITPEFLKHRAPLSIINIKSSKKNRPLHDLNALAETGLLNLHLESVKAEDPSLPFLPIAGITFAHSIAATLLAGIIKSRKAKDVVEVSCFLDKIIQETLSPLFPKEMRDKKHYSFLHNGRYPCYNIYYSKDNVAYALAAIEQKYYENFIHNFNLKIDPNSGLTDDKKVMESIKKAFASKKSQEVDGIIESAKKSHEMCLSRVLL